MFTLLYEDKPVLDDLDLRDRYYEIRKLLLAHACSVTFTKVNGETRTITCTLRTDAMPQSVVTQEFQTTKLLDYKVLSVWCLNESEWRSFRVANVKQVIYE